LEKSPFGKEKAQKVSLWKRKSTKSLPLEKKKYKKSPFGKEKVQKVSLWKREI